jgi:hypothetical protein
VLFPPFSFISPVFITLVLPLLSLNMLLQSLLLLLLLLLLR